MSRKLVLLLTILAMVVFVTSCPVAPGTESPTGWSVVGAKGFSSGAADYVSLALDPSDGTPYVAYVDQSLHSGYPDVQKLGVGGWSSLGDAGDSSVTSSAYHYTSLAMAAGIPYLAYSYPADGYTIGTRRYVTGAWEALDSFEYSASSTHAYLSLKEYSEGLTLMFQDNYSSAAGKIAYYYAYLPSSTTFGSYGTFPANSASFVSLALYGGTPYVAFKDDVTGKANVWADSDGMRPYGNANFSDGAADYTSIVVNSSGTPYVAYSDATVGGKVTVKLGNGSTWADVGAKGFSAGAATFVSLAIDADDVLYVAYSDGGHSNKVTVQKFDGADWVVLGTAGFSDGTAEYVSLAVHGTTPIVAFKDGSASGKVTVMTPNP